MYPLFDRYHSDTDKDYDPESKEKIKMEFELHRFGRSDHLYGSINEVIENLKDLKEDFKDKFDELVLDNDFTYTGGAFEGEMCLVGIRYETDEEFEDRQLLILAFKDGKKIKKQEAKEKRKKQYERLRKEFDNE